MTTVHAGPTSDLDPFDDAFLVDPFPALDELRETGPVVHLPRYDVWGRRPSSRRPRRPARPPAVLLRRRRRYRRPHHEGVRLAQAQPRPRGRPADPHREPVDPGRGYEPAGHADLPGGVRLGGGGAGGSSRRPRQHVRDDPSLARNAFDEVVRHQSPVIGFFRTTTADAEWEDTVIPARRKVMVFFAGANRDPRHWDRPDTFDVRRRTAGNLGYGAGPHVCAGMTIARMEGEALIRALAARVGSWHLDGDPEPRLNNSLRGLSRLPVQVQSI